MRILIALGGNALLRRGEIMSAANQRANVKIAASQIAAACADHEPVIVHGNGPQVGLLALQNEAYTEVPAYPFDILGAESQGMIGYMIEQELRALLPNKNMATLVTMVEVDKSDPAFKNPTKFIGRVYEKEEAERLARQNGWEVRPDGDKYRRVVPSPAPLHIVQLPAIETLLKSGAMIVAGGGGGVPCVREASGALTGVEAVIDKDSVGSLMARDVKADMLIIATDVSGIYVDYKQPSQKVIKEANPTDLMAMPFAKGSMGPKVEAACSFAAATGKDAVIGSLEEIGKIIAGQAGTRVNVSVKGIVYV